MPIKSPPRFGLTFRAMIAGPATTLVDSQHRATAWTMPAGIRLRQKESIRQPVGEFLCPCTTIDRLLQHMPHRSEQTQVCASIERLRDNARMKARLKQDLIGIEVSY